MLGKEYGNPSHFKNTFLLLTYSAATTTPTARLVKSPAFAEFEAESITVKSKSGFKSEIEP